MKVYINNVEVDNYRTLGPSLGRLDIQQIVVQVGALGNPTPGTELPITVVVNGVVSNNDKTFTANPGRILFVDEIANIGQGNLIQTFDNLGTAELNNLNIHHNLMHHGGRYGLNISGGTNSMKAWNNVIYNTALAGVRFSVQTNSSSNFAILYNTVYNTNTVSSAANAPVVNDWNLYSGTAVFENNIVTTGPNTAASQYYYIDSGNASALQIKRNLWNGRALGKAPTQDTDPVGGNTDLLNPLFTNAGGGDLSLSVGSPAIGKALLTTPFVVADDYRQTARPSASAPDVGAYQR